VNKRAKVRAALIRIPDVQDVLIDEQIVFQMSKNARPDADALAEKVEEFELDAGDLESTQTYLW